MLACLYDVIENITYGNIGDIGTFLFGDIVHCLVKIKGNSSSLLNDRLETQAIKKVFGEDACRIPVSSLKSQIGHSTVAAGAVEAIACILMLKRQKVAPTINLTDPDPECDLDYVTEGSREVTMDYVLSNSFGFGGQNACLVFKKETI